MTSKLFVTAIGLALGATALPAWATDPDAEMEADSGDSDFFREVGEGLRAATEREDLNFANEQMREMEAREQAERDERVQEAREREQAERDNYQREEYERRANDPDGPF